MYNASAEQSRMLGRRKNASITRATRAISNQTLAPILVQSNRRHVAALMACGARAL